ncbi:sialate O-acetylesterase [Dyadobacter psychrotolerans]|uniref:Sialate O-acetylesterase n=1 Tax=Dyadobacter psychrotolerans TaxID=2541721 RepID=A0A4R5DK59_9BACT|nr:sialate O-acetylesterase [Dyadobacter psychrotolerans]TDE11003.1 sialate O-acetylesterase [Dyadobacter psychrotolerans]
MKRMTWCLIISVLVFQVSFANVSLPNVFGSHMVLQRRKPVPVWGWAAPNENVTITLLSQVKTVQAGKDGKWRVSLDPMEAGGPYRLIAKGKNNTITFEDVLVGEVWICSGQSNMEWPLRSAANAKTEIPKAIHPQIRQLLVKKSISLTPKDNIEGSWAVCSPETAPNFTAVGYFFAKQLQGELHVPIGLINTSWGGTHSETWTSREAMNQNEELKLIANKLPATYEEVIQGGAERIKVLIQTQQGGLPTAAEEQTWSKADFDDSVWKTMDIPRDWEWAGLTSLDGIVWFRLEVVIPPGSKLSKMQLHIGSIEDNDSTFVNGQLIGSKKGRGAREYVIPEGLLKPGRNVIAVRVVDTGAVGGMVGPREQLNLVGESLIIPLAGLWKYRVASVFASSYKPGSNTYATQLFNAMLNPLIPYAIQGTIWYQGETNAKRAYQYRKTFPLMIQDWRQHWGYDFPFLYVQLASYNALNGNSRNGSTWAELREAQTMTLQLPNTGMAVTSDIGERMDIHPKNKEDVGKRLAAEAMRVAYHKNEAGSDETSRGPQFDKMTIDGNKAILTFRNVGQGLFAKDKYGYLRGFEVAGSDQKFYYAKAAIQGNSIVVHADSVTTPLAVRYGWADDNGDVNLYNRDNFPAIPFRTDTWKGITEAVKFGE